MHAELIWKSSLEQHVTGLQVRDFRNDVILAEACRRDVESYCKDAPAGMLPCETSLIWAPTPSMLE